MNRSNPSAPVDGAGTTPGACPTGAGRARPRITAGVLLASALALGACTEAPTGSGRSVPAGSAAAEPVPGLGAALPPSEVANAAPDGPTDLREAHRLLTQGTFGAQRAALDDAAAQGPDTWIDDQMRQPVTWMLPALRARGRDGWNEHVNIWWRHALSAPDQLRQRVAFALSEILVISSATGLGDQQEGIANYYDLLLRHAFGNYRTLLEEITLSPVMGDYLSMKGNRKPDPDENIRPDENYARELLQLFGIGLERLNPDGTPKLDGDGVPLPTYDQSVVEGFAHVFTGWHFANAEEFRWPKNENYIEPMTPWEDFHDKGEKVLLDGFRVPPGQNARDDLRMALDNVFNHPNVGPFISKQLIQRLVTSNPSPGYVRDVAAVFDRNAAGERGALGSTIKAILMHREARLGHQDAPDTFGKVKEPLLRVTQMWRAFPPDRLHDEFNYAWAATDLGQAPLTSPSVFNFFRPDFAQPGEVAEAGLVSPEFEILDDTSMITVHNRLASSALWNHNHRDSPNRNTAITNIDRELAMETDREALVDHLDLLLLGGRMTETLRREALDLMASRERGEAYHRVAEAIFLIITSPEAAIQR